MLATVMAIGISLARCDGPETYQLALARLALPPSWELADERVEMSTDFCLICPRVYRYYLASGELPALLQEVEQAVQADGYPDVFVSDPNCDRNSNAALCSITARSRDVRVLVAVYPPGQDVDNLGVSRPDRATILFEALAA